MAIIFTNADFHIEYFDLPAQAVGAGGEYNQLATLSKPGRFVGASAFVRSVSLDRDTGSVGIHNQVAGVLTYGQSITGVRVLLRTVAAQTISCGVLIFIRN